LAVNSELFVGIEQCFVQEGVLLIQYTAGYIYIFIQKLGAAKGLITQYKNKIDLISSNLY